MAKNREALKYALRLRAGHLAERINDYALAERLGKDTWFDTPEELEMAEKELEEILAQIKELENGTARRSVHNRRSIRRPKTLNA
jgi:hypothetical protein